MTSDLRTRMRAADPAAALDQTNSSARAQGEVHLITQTAQPRRSRLSRWRRRLTVGLATFVAATGTTVAVAIIIVPEQVRDAFAAVAANLDGGGAMSDLRQAAAGPLMGGGTVELWTARSPWGGWCAQSRLLRPGRPPQVNSLTCAEEDNDDFQPLRSSRYPMTEPGEEVDGQPTALLYWRPAVTTATKVVLRGEAGASPWSLTLAPDSTTRIVLAQVPQEIRRNGTATAYDSNGAVVQVSPLGPP